MNHEIVRLLVLGGVFGMAFIIGIVILALNYMQQMEKIKRQPVGGSKELSEAIEAIRKELADLRETSTRYDVSFDTALQRMESRLGNLEAKTSRIEQETSVSIGSR